MQTLKTLLNKEIEPDIPVDRVPLTEDHEAVFAVINALSPNLMTSKGTNLGAGIETAISAFPTSQARQGTIVLFTDGEETIQSLEKSLEMDKERFIRLKKDEIIPFIEEELATRYWFQEAGVKVRLRYDEQLKKALAAPLPF